MFEEKQVPYKKGNKWIRKVYVYNNEGKKGHPIAEREDEVPESEAVSLLPKPTVLVVNLLNDDELKEVLFPKIIVIRKWLKEDPIMHALFTREALTLSKKDIKKLLEIVEDARDDEESAMDAETAALLITFFKSKLDLLGE